jgi:hypothetical protein
MDYTDFFILYDDDAYAGRPGVTTMLTPVLVDAPTRPREKAVEPPTFILGLLSLSPTPSECVVGPSDCVSLHSLAIAPSESVRADAAPALVPPARAAPVADSCKKKKKKFKNSNLNNSNVDSAPPPSAEAAPERWADMASDSAPPPSVEADKAPEGPMVADDGWGVGLPAAPGPERRSYADTAKVDFLSIFIQWKNQDSRSPFDEASLLEFFSYFGFIVSVRIPPVGSRRPSAYVRFRCEQAHADALMWSGGPYAIRQATVSTKFQGKVLERPLARVQCLFWIRGHCTYGASCKFGHFS